MTDTPRGICCGCGRPFPIRIDGTVRHHRAYVDGNSTGTCPGSYQEPASTDQNQENGS